MGWSFSCDRNHDKAALIAELRNPRRYGSQKLIKSSVVGNHHWYVAEITEGPNAGKRYIGLDLMQSGYPQHGWGYKDLTASMGPCAVDCPIGFLDLAPDSGGFETAWREKVRAHHARKAERRAEQRNNPHKANDVVRLGTASPKHYWLLTPLGTRGWRVLCLDDGYHYRMPRAHLAKSVRVSPEDAAPLLRPYLNLANAA